MSRINHLVFRRAGMTMLELIIVLPMITILTIILMTLIINSLKSYRYSQAQAQGSYQIANYLERVGRVTRGAIDIESADSKSLVMHAYFSPRDSVPDRVRYFVDNSGTLKVGTVVASGTAPNYTYNTGNEQVTVLLSNIKNDDTTPVFTYYDDNGNQLTGSITPASIKEIGIRLDINPDPSVLKSNLTGQTRINLRNRKTNL